MTQTKNFFCKGDGPTFLKPLKKVEIRDINRALLQYSRLDPVTGNIFFPFPELYLKQTK